MPGSWSSFRHRPAQHSLPANNYPYTPAGKSSPKVTVPQTDSPTSFRRFEEKPFPQFSENLEAKLTQGNDISHVNQNSMPRLQSSFSTSDIPTMRTSNHMNTQSFGRIQMERPRHSREPSASGEILNSVPSQYFIFYALKAYNSIGKPGTCVWPSSVDRSWTNACHDTSWDHSSSLSWHLWSVWKHQHGKLCLSRSALWILWPSICPRFQNW